MKNIDKSFQSSLRVLCRQLLKGNSYFKLKGFCQLLILLSLLKVVNQVVWVAQYFCVLGVNHIKCLCVVGFFVSTVWSKISLSREYVGPLNYCF